MEAVAMPYWLDAKNLRMEISASETQRKGLMSGLEDMLEKFQGPGRIQGLGNDYWRENHAFEWVSLVLPQTLFRNPQVRISTKRSSIAEWDAIALEHALNRWIVDTDYKRHLERVGLDWCFTFGVSMVTVEKYGADQDDPKHRPRTIHLDPEQFGMDALARSPETARMMFHKCVDTKQSLRNRAKVEDGWNLKAIEDLAAMTLDDPSRPKADGIPNRNEVAWYEAWVPELNDDDDEEYHGKILTIGVATGGEAMWLREPRAYYGPRWGPYTLFGAYSVPRSAWPMGPLQAHDGHVRELNLHAQANSNSAARRKTVFVFDETNKETAGKLTNAKDGEAIGIPGLSKDSMLNTFETPGVTEDALVYEQWKRGSLERISGLNDRAKGETEGGATATADAIAARGSAARMSWLEQKLYEAVQREQRTVAWYYWHDDQITEELPAEAAQQISQAMGVEIPQGTRVSFRGGNDGSFDDLELLIEPYSMQRVDEASMQARTLQMLQVMTGLAPVMAQTPWMPWQSICKKVSEVMNWPEVAKVDTELLAVVSGMLLQSQDPIAAAQQPQQEGPRFTGDRTGSGKGGGPKPAYGGPQNRMPRPSEYGQQSNLPGQSTGAKAGRAAQGAA